MDVTERVAIALWPYIGCEPCEPVRHRIPWTGDGTAANSREKDFARHAAEAAIRAYAESA
jgi:hypothetical protein